MPNNLLTVTGTITALEIKKVQNQAERLRAAITVRMPGGTTISAGVDFLGKGGEHLQYRFHIGDTVTAIGRVDADRDGTRLRFDNLSVVPADTPHRKHVSVFGYVAQADYDGCEDFNIRPDGGSRRCRVWVSEQDAAKIGLKPGAMAAVEGTYEIRRCKNYLGEPADRIYLIPETQ